MNFLLIRHADAVSADEVPDLADADRPLTPAGLAQCEALAAGLRRLNVSLGKVLTSPCVRARQTAEKLLEHLHLPAQELEICEPLRPGVKHKKLSRKLHLLECDTVTLVGHNPDLSLYAGWLIGSKKAQVELAKGGAAYIRGEAGPAKGTGELVWMVTPEWCTS
jgi:phosphohistidine phosphatase